MTKEEKEIIDGKRDAFVAGAYFESNCNLPIDILKHLAANHYPYPKKYKTVKAFSELYRYKNGFFEYDLNRNSGNNTNWQISTITKADLESMIDLIKNPFIDDTGDTEE